MDLSKVMISESLNSVLHQLNESGRAAVLDMIKTYHDQYKEMSAEEEPENLAYSVHVSIDEIVDEQERQTLSHHPDKSVSCRSGCSFCCFQSVDVTKDEARLLLMASKENGVKIDRERLKRQAEAGLNGFQALPLSDRRCVFLGQDNKCTVYEYRPVACRKLVVTSKPEFCDTETNPGAQIEKIVSVEAEAISAAMCTAVDSGIMGEMILKSKP